MKTGENKVELDITLWRKHEEQIVKLFPSSVVNSREFQLEKLSKLDAIYFTHARSVNMEEKLTLKMLNIERRQLEKQLFPKFWQQLLRRIKGNKNEMVAAHQMEQQRRNNEQLLKDVLVKEGFGNINWQRLAQHLQKGESSFSIDHSYYVSTDKRMQFDLSFTKDGQGNYQFSQYQAVLKSDNNSDLPKQQTFILEPGNSVTASQAFNLLEGRAVQQEFVNAAGGKQSTWIKLDFNDKDANGNFRKKEFHYSDADLVKSLQALPIQEKASPQAIENLLAGIQNGDRQTVVLQKEGNARTASIEVNPQFKNIDLYDNQRKKINLSKAVGEDKEKSQVIQLSQQPQQKQSRQQRL